MPELPEVETVRRGLAAVMEGRRIDAVRVNRADLRWPLPADLAAGLAGRRVDRLGRRSKYLLAGMEGGNTLILHLGMSGRMLVSGAVIGGFHHAPAPDGKHDHVVFQMEGGVRIAFNDARRFGMIDLVASAAADGHRLLAGLGPEPLGNGFDAARLAPRMRGRAPVKAVLLDQRVVAGLGNIYVSEALFRAGIAPDRPAGSLAAADLERLVPAIRDVLTEAIAAGGSSLRDYRQADGGLGYFQHAFRVYGRAGRPCPQCGAPILRIVQQGRSSFYCPACQR